MTFSGLTEDEGGLSQMIRVVDTKLGFTKSPEPHLQNVCAETCVNVPVKLLPITVTGVPPEGGPLPGSIFAILHGGWTELLDISDACSSMRHPQNPGIDARSAALDRRCSLLKYSRVLDVSRCADEQR